jgi:hypothetical protein
MPSAPPALPSVPAAYRRALEDLAAVCTEARALAELLEYAARLLRGGKADPEGPPLDAVPPGSRIVALLARWDRSLDAASRVWDSLPAAVREGLLPPADMLKAAEAG